MAFKIQCPGCEANLKLAEPPAKDMKLKCPKCKEVISVKAAAAPAEEAPKPKASPAGKAAAKAKASNKRKKAKASGKKKAKRAAPVNDDWDDYEDLGGNFDDFEDDFEDGYGDDDFDDPKPARGKKREGGATAAKGKGKAPAKSQGDKKGLKIALGVLIGLGVIGGGIFGVMQMMGGDDSSEVASTDSGDNTGQPARPAADGTVAASTGGQPTTPSTVDAAGQNFVNLQYIPANADLIVHARVSELMASPLMQQVQGALPPQLQQAQGAVKPESVESIVAGIWFPQGQTQGSTNQNNKIIPVMFQNGQGMGGRPGPGMGGQFGGAGFGGPQMAMANFDTYVFVMRMKQDVSASDLGEVKNTVTHSGKEIHEVTDPNSGQPQMMWLADKRTVVGGKLEQVQAAIDRGSPESRFERFDFAKSSSHLTLAFAPSNPKMLAEAPVPPGQLPVNPADLNGACVQLNVTDALRLDVQIACKDSGTASTLQQDLTKRIGEGQQQLDAQVKSMGFGGIVMVPVQKIVGRIKATTNGDMVVVNADATSDELNALSKTVGPMVQGMMGGAGGMGSGGGPPGFTMGGPEAKDDVPFAQQTEATVDFEENIAPILKWRCGSCHIDKSEGGLSLASYEALMAHSSDNGKAVTPKEPEASSFFTIVRDAPSPHPKLKASEVALIRGWIAAGAQPPGQKSKIELPPTEMKPTESESANAGGEMSSLSYAKDVAPIMKRHCGGCHINSKKGNFSLASLQSFTNHTSPRNGKALDPGNPNSSSLYSLVASGRMPKGPQKVPQKEIDIIGRWITGGAKP